MIEMIVLDVDGCLTDGRIYYTDAGEEVKAFSVKDGLGISAWVRLGKKVAIITGRRSKIVERRAKELGVTHLHQGVKDKKTLLASLIEQEGLNWGQVAAIGDDWNDIGMLESVGWSFTPADGAKPIQERVQTRLISKGGRGAVREMIDKILEKDGLQGAMETLWH
jgi:3-deoxy-D-manno-octulosonate 8-phosphate phosphatase (KDO 8-P phosphatase)